MKATFIKATTQFTTRTESVSAPLFKKVFIADADKRAVVKIRALGFYKIFLNGKEFTKGYLAPYISNPEQIVYEDVYDVTGLLKKGENVLCVWLGNGFVNVNDKNLWLFESAPYRSAPSFALTLEQDGQTLVKTDESFLWTASPVLRDDYRSGVHYDARLEREGVLENADMDGYFQPVVAGTPTGEVRFGNPYYVRETRRIKPKQILKTSQGYVYDFGENNAGVYELNVNFPAGKTLDLYFGEWLEKGEFDQKNIANGCVVDERRQRDVYICNGKPSKYIPPFTFHGYQYVLVKGLDEGEATADLLTYIVLQGGFEKRGTFVCSNELINKLQDCTVRSDASNFFYYPTDCPHREKNGWTGDVALSAEQYLLNFDCADYLEEYLASVRGAQREDGALPGIVPTGGWGFAWGSGPNWDIVLFELVWQVYRFKGDKKVIYENKSAMEKYIAYMRTKEKEDGLFEYGLPDWCEAGTISYGLVSTPTDVTDACACIGMLKKASYLFREIGEIRTADEYSAYAQKISESFRKKYIRGAWNTAETQTAQALSIAYGLFDKKDEKQAVENLLTLIERTGDTFKVGVLGALHFFEVLAENGHANLALELITKDKFPSFKYWLDRGATTLAESFFEYVSADSMDRKDNGVDRPSLNHHFWGMISTFFYRHIAGLDVRDKNTVRIAPDKVTDVAFASASFTDGDRFVKVERTFKEGQLHVLVENKGFDVALALESYAVGGEKSLNIPEGSNFFVCEKV